MAAVDRSCLPRHLYARLRKAGSHGRARIPRRDSGRFSRHQGPYAGTVKLEEVEAPSHYKLVLDGRGRQGSLKGAGTIDLTEQTDHTVLHYRGDVHLGGPLVSVGQRMLDGAAKMMLGQFFSAPEAGLRAAPDERVRQSGLINLWQAFANWLRGLCSAPQENPYETPTLQLCVPPPGR